LGRNQFRGFSRAVNPFFCLVESLPADADVESGAVFVTAGFRDVVLGERDSEFDSASCAGRMGSSSVKRTTSTFGGGAGGLSLLAGGGDVAATTRVGGADVTGFVRGGRTAADCVDEAANDLLALAFGVGLLVVGGAGAGWGSEAT